jgi:hypothetical protein
MVPERFKKTLKHKLESGRNNSLANARSEGSSNPSHMPNNLVGERKLISSRVNLAPVKDNFHIVRRVTCRLTIESS